MIYYKSSSKDWKATSGRHHRTDDNKEAVMPAPNHAKKAAAATKPPATNVPAQVGDLSKIASIRTTYPTPLRRDKDFDSIAFVDAQAVTNNGFAAFDAGRARLVLTLHGGEPTVVYADQIVSIRYNK